MALDVPSYLLGKSKGGGGANLQTKSVTISNNGSTTVSPDEGYDGMTSVSVTTNVQPNNQSKSVTITSNTTTTISPDQNYDGLSSVEVTTNVSVSEPEEKDVNFYDYDGTLLYSYTAPEFLQLTELPANPTHTGLTAQGWNWDLAEAKLNVQDMGAMDIGQSYITDDGSTRFYIELQNERTTPYLSLYLSGSMSVDWGDNSATETITGSSINTRVDAHHTYATGGNYVIKVTPINSTTNFRIQAVSVSGTNIGPIWSGETSWSGSKNIYYANTLKKLEIGDGFLGFGTGALSYCADLETITTPNTNFGYANGCFYNCKALKHYTFAKNTPLNTNITQAFLYCNNIKQICLTDISIGSDFASNCDSLKKIVIPRLSTNQNARSIGNSAFNGCLELKYIYIGSAINSIGSNTFSGNYTHTVKLGNRVQTLGQSAFAYCSCITKLKFPTSLKTIYAQAFSGCLAMKLYDFTDCTSIPTLNDVSAFNSIPSDCYIVVPDDLYETWKTANRWADYASNIIKKSDYDAL